MRSFRIKAIGALVITALSAGCTDAIFVADGDLTTGEAFALAAQLGLESMSFAQGQDGSQPGATATSRPAAAPESVHVDYSFTRPCVLGGSVLSSGAIDVSQDLDADWSTVDVVATDEHRRCVFMADGTRVTVTGDPDVTVEVHVAEEAGEAVGVQVVSVLGAVLWETDDERSGRCAIDILIEVDADADTQTTHGAFCGHSFNVTVSDGS